MTRTADGTAAVTEMIVAAVHRVMISQDAVGQGHHLRCSQEKTENLVDEQVLQLLANGKLNRICNLLFTYFIWSHVSVT